MCKESNPRLIQLRLKQAGNGRRRPSVTRFQDSVTKPSSWKFDDAYDPRVVSIVVGSDGCAHAGAAIQTTA